MVTSPLLKRIALCLPLLALLGIVLGVPTVAFGDDDTRSFHARLLGVNETPSISTDGTGSLKLTINGSGATATIDYTLTYSALRAPAVVAHVHFGQARVAGQVVFFLCGGPTTPACPAGGGTVTGTVHAANVVGPSIQGIEAGEIDRAIKAIREGAAYGNVHSTKFGGGEIRGQLVRSRDG